MMLVDVMAAWDFPARFCQQCIDQAHGSRSHSPGKQNHCRPAGHSAELPAQLVVIGHHLLSWRSRDCHEGELRVLCLQRALLMPEALCMKNHEGFVMQAKSSDGITIEVPCPTGPSPTGCTDPQGPLPPQTGRSLVRRCLATWETSGSNAESSRSDPCNLVR